MTMTKPRNHTPALPRPVVLVGLMGAGKSKIGRMLAASLGVDFIDSDAAIEKSTGVSIAHIFDTKGEAHFRKIEAATLKRLIESSAPSIIATGGGAFIHPETRGFLNTHAITIRLKAAPKTLAQRISNPASRPLLAGKDTAAIIKTLADLADSREPAYATAHITVDTDGLDTHAALEKLQSALITHLDRNFPCDS